MLAAIIMFGTFFYVVHVLDKIQFSARYCFNWVINQIMKDRSKTELFHGLITRVGRGHPLLGHFHLNSLFRKKWQQIAWYPQF